MVLMPESPLREVVQSCMNHKTSQGDNRKVRSMMFLKSSMKIECLLKQVVLVGVSHVPDTTSVVSLISHNTPVRHIGFSSPVTGEEIKSAAPRKKPKFQSQ